MIATDEPMTEADEPTGTPVTQAAPADGAAAPAPVAAQAESPTASDTAHDDPAHASAAAGDAAHDDHGDAAGGDAPHDDHAHESGEHEPADGEHAEGDHAHGHHSFLDQSHLMGHVQDTDKFEFSFWLTGKAKNEGGTPLHLNLPQAAKLETPIVGSTSSPLQPLDLKLTKFMVLEVLVAFALIAVFVPLARKIRTGERPKGRWWNLIETLILYVRDQVARPSIGHHDADHFMPYLWTAFFFILFCNLCGLIPFLGSPTGALGVTAVLAASTLLVVIGTGVKKLGPVGFLKSQVPHMELPLIMAIPIVPLIFLIELVGLFIKHFVLSIRLFANMFAGHLVLAVLLAFIGETWGSSLVYAVAPASIGACVAVNLLELFVAFLQAYIFTFLSALFIGAAAHPH